MGVGPGHEARLPADSLAGAAEEGHGTEGVVVAL